jgi:ABC-2 type transport system ATP-binding protein
LQVASDTQVVYAEFDGTISKQLLAKIPGISKLEQVNPSTYLIESESIDDLRKTVAQFAQQNNLLVLTLRTEEKSLEEVFKTLTK